ncbi:hypothetical protein DFH08DRAFT_186392 [Mycena albidolilacea]|uniref:Uncharacterized protein n=1 Tax=Mycena albidolilacea TaxID=1033008 RepID=A0AAD7ASH6_9AGAR|nr:hypothetical protein DFH08DRAFT_186392 [Mycena albidolilacea]
MGVNLPTRIINNRHIRDGVRWNCDGPTRFHVGKKSVTTQIVRISFISQHLHKSPVVVRSEFGAQQPFCHVLPIDQPFSRPPVRTEVSNLRCRSRLVSRLRLRCRQVEAAHARHTQRIGLRLPTRPLAESHACLPDNRQRVTVPRTDVRHDVQTRGGQPQRPSGTRRNLAADPMPAKSGPHATGGVVPRVEHTVLGRRRPRPDAQGIVPGSQPLHTQWPISGEKEPVG